MADILFLPDESLVQCVNISIARDFVVEDTETFLFVIASNQSDLAVLVDDNAATSVVSILDEPGGKDIKFSCGISTLI